MSKNNKKNVVKTPTERKKQLKNKNRLYFGGEIGCVTLPFILLCIFNREEYFVKNNGYKISISFFMMIFTFVIIICAASKKKLKLDLSSIFFGLIIADSICFILQELIKDLAYILLYTLIGITCALILELKRKKSYIPEIEKLEKAIEKANEEELVEEVKQEKKKVKIKIKQ